jgi:hypothetical protein
MQSGCDKSIFWRFLLCVMWRIAEDRPYLHDLCTTRPTTEAPFRVSTPDKAKSIPNHPITISGNKTRQSPVFGATRLHPLRGGSISRTSSLRIGKQVALRRLSRTIRQSSLRFLSMVLSATSSSDSHLELDGSNIRDTVRSPSSDSITHTPPSSCLSRMAVLFLFRYVSSAWSKPPSTGSHVHMKRLVLQILYHMNLDFSLQPPVASFGRVDSGLRTEKLLSNDSSDMCSSFQGMTSVNIEKP